MMQSAVALAASKEATKVLGDAKQEREQLGGDDARRSAAAGTLARVQGR